MYRLVQKKGSVLLCNRKAQAGRTFSQLSNLSFAHLCICYVWWKLSDFLQAIHIFRISLGIWLQVTKYGHGHQSQLTLRLLISALSSAMASLTFLSSLDKISDIWLQTSSSIISCNQRMGKLATLKIPDIDWTLHKVKVIIISALTLRLRFSVTWPRTSLDQAGGSRAVEAKMVTTATLLELFILS